MSIPKATAYRLSLYLRQLEDFAKKNILTVSSKNLGLPLGIKDAQVRKDFAHFGQFGSPGVGYNVIDLIDAIKKIIGRDRNWPVVVVGVGNLGRALLSYKGFAKQGFEIQGAFDINAKKVGKVIGSVPVLHVEHLADFIKQNSIKLAILSVNVTSAQPVTDILVKNGIKGILNFAPVNLVIPETVELVNVDLAVQLEQLSFRLRVGNSDNFI